MQLYLDELERMSKMPPSIEKARLADSLRSNAAMIALIAVARAACNLNPTTDLFGNTDIVAKASMDYLAKCLGNLGMVASGDYRG